MKKGQILLLVWAMVVGVISLSARSSAQNAPSQDALQAGKELASVITGQMVADAAIILTAQVWPSMESSLRAQNPKLDAATLAELRREYERLITRNYAEVMTEAPVIYARYFTGQEMRDLVAFYGTPLGAKTLRVMPQAIADFTTTSIPRLQGLQEKVGLAFLNILQKRGYYGQ